MQICIMDLKYCNPVHLVLLHKPIITPAGKIIRDPYNILPSNPPSKHRKVLDRKSPSW